MGFFNPRPESRERTPVVLFEFFKLSFFHSFSPISISGNGGRPFIQAAFFGTASFQETQTSAQFSGSKFYRKRPRHMLNKLYPLIDEKSSFLHDGTLHSLILKKRNNDLGPFGAGILHTQRNPYEVPWKVLSSIFKSREREREN